MSEDELTQRRAYLVRQKKRELDEAYDTHDSLLRELFHLHKFVTLIGFDPHIAKQEKSEVWEEFRKPYDLWDTAAAGPSSRRTRRAINERRASLIGSSSQAPAPANKRKPSDVAPSKTSVPNSSFSPTSVLLAPKRSRGAPRSCKAKVVKSKSFTDPFTPARGGINTLKRPYPLDTDQDDEEDKPRGSPTMEYISERVSGLSVDSDFPHKRKQKHIQPPVTPITAFPPSSPDVPLPSSPAYPESPPTATPLPKRIRLIVKPPPPPPIATHPAQLARPAAFGGSLSRLLSSFALLEEGDENDVVERRSIADPSIRRPGEVTPTTSGNVVKPKIGMSWDEFEESVKAENEIWRRIREVKAQGGLRCMRGWEIVRGGEEEPEEVEEEGTADEQADGGVDTSPGEGMVEQKEQEAAQIQLLADKDEGFAPVAEDQTELETASPRGTNIDAQEAVADTLNSESIILVEGGPSSGDGDQLRPAERQAESALGLISHAPDLATVSNDVLGPVDTRERSPELEADLVHASDDQVESSWCSEHTHADTEGTETAKPTGLSTEQASMELGLALRAETPTPQTTATAAPMQPPTLGLLALNPAEIITVTPPSTVPLPLPPLPFLPPSHYEKLVAAIPAHARQVKTAPLTLRHRPATLIARHWERLQGAADRLAAAEERRVRAGAKALARGVVSKAWKDAVAVIRARLREQEEAEQAREGRKHLAAILEQSSALLETQQEDLGLGRRHPKGRSRSMSSGALQSRSRSRSSRVEERTESGEDGDEGGDGESVGSGDTEVEVEEGGVSEMLLGLGSRDASEGDRASNGEPREMEADEEENSDVDVGDRVDLAAFRIGSVPAMEDGQGEPDSNETIALSDIFDTGASGDYDMSIEPELRSPEAMDVISAAGSDAMSLVEVADAPQGQHSDHSMEGEQPPDIDTRVPDIINGHATVIRAQTPPITNGHYHTPTASVPSTPRSVAAGLISVNSTVPTPSGVRKLTLKLKSPGPTSKESTTRRSSRCASVPRSRPAEDTDSELGGLAQDAEMPLEELMKKYGYVGINEVGADQSSTPHEPDSDDEDEAEDEAEDTKATGALLGLENMTTLQESGVRPPFLLRGILRPYQQAGLEWLVSGYVRGNNGILADEMGLGKTIQTIALLAHLACDRGIWGPHLIIVPTSVILNWEMEFKKFLPGFKVLSYYGSIKERKERRVGWNTEHSFNVVVTSYQLVLADQAIFRRKRWHYMILDEAHNIKNFKSQRWATLFSFNSERRLLLTGTPLQNNITELWSLLYFVQPDTANKQQFEDWFLETMRHAVETGNTMDEQTRDTIDKLHTVLRPYILRRLKCDVEQQLPAKHEHIVYCRLSKRQRYLYDEFMSRAQTKETLAGGNFLSIVNCLMQLRKVCNHPDLFEVRPILTSFAIPSGRSAVVDYEIKELLVRRRLLKQFDDDGFDVDNHSFDIITNAAESTIVSEQRAVLNPSQIFPTLAIPGEPPPKDLRTIAGNKRWVEYQRLIEMKQRHQQITYINTRRNTRFPILGAEKLSLVRSLVDPPVPTDVLEQRRPNPDTKFGVARMIKSYAQREEMMSDVIDRFAFATPNVVALDVPRLSLAPIAPSNCSGHVTINPTIQHAFSQPEFDILHRASVKLQIAFPDSSLLQYDCGKLQELDALLREKHAGGHRILIFTQMTRVLDILEIFLNFHGYRYLRLDGSTKIEQRQVVTERFNVDNRIFAFIASSRSGGVGINLTGADTVIFYDSDYNPSMDRQCEDRAHRIGQTREVSIYRFISKHTVEEAMLRKANQKRLLDDIVIQQGEFDWRQVMVDDVRMERALAEVEDKVDADAAKMATSEEQRMDWNDFGSGDKDGAEGGTRSGGWTPQVAEIGPSAQDPEEDEDEGLKPIERYMLRVVENDWDFFC